MNVIYKVQVGDIEINFVRMSISELTNFQKKVKSRSLYFVQFEPDLYDGGYPEPVSAAPHPPVVIAGEIVIGKLLSGRMEIKDDEPRDFDITNFTG